MTRNPDRGFDRTVAGLAAGVVTLGSLFLSVFSGYLLMCAVTVGIGRAGELLGDAAAARASVLSYLGPALGCAIGAAVLVAIVAVLARFALGPTSRFRAGRVLTLVNTVAGVAVLVVGLIQALGS